MSKKNNGGPVYDLIKSLTKSEKRSFKLYAQRMNEPGDLKFVRLFDLLDGMNDYDEKILTEKFPGSTRAQLANLKSHLYKQLLLVLRLNYLKNDVDIQLREKLDYVRVLYKKGLYDQSLKMLNRVKGIAQNYRKNIFKLALLNYEKNIENQQVIHLNDETAMRLDIETKQLLTRINKGQQFFTLALLMKARFLKNGLISNDNERQETISFFESNLPKYEESKMSFSEKYNMCRAFYWYAYILGDFETCCVYTEKWVALFKQDDLHLLRHAEYLKGLSRLLQSLFRVGDPDRFVHFFEELHAFERQNRAHLDENSKLLWLRYITIHRFNLCFMQGKFSENRIAIKEALRKIKQFARWVDANNLMVIYYKAAIFYFVIGEFKSCYKYLDQVIDNKLEGVRGDLKSFALLLRVIARHESADDEHFARRLTSTKTALKNLGEFNTFHQVILDFLRKMDGLLPGESQKEIASTKTQLEELFLSSYGSKSLMYFDSISWLESKMTGLTFEQVVRNKRKEGNMH